ncbi:MAG: hypothetical protein NTW86_31215 [Candidatus Sumerlaeota bacterium]|nr:hypothetical protein [Candidatus Sumerlaeota bacterium]
MTGVSLARRRSEQAAPRKIDGAAEAKLVALGCSPPPAGRRRVAATESKTRLDWAGQVRRLPEEDYPMRSRRIWVLPAIDLDDAMRRKQGTGGRYVPALPVMLRYL